MLWRLFTSRPEPEPESMACILEEYGLYFIDDEYRQLGEREGWLKRTGYYRDNKNRLVWTFRHIRR